jgi:hypothetical protein
MGTPTETTAQQTFSQQYQDLKRGELVHTKVIDSLLSITRTSDQQLVLENSQRTNGDGARLHSFTDELSIR